MLRILSRSLIITSLLLPVSAFSGQVRVINTEIKPLNAQQYRFDVTLEHADTGWDHYADRWEILAPDGTLLATRTLYHPHVNEQPFTRSLTTTLPKGTSSVMIRGHDKVHGYSQQNLSLDLPSER